MFRAMKNDNIMPSDTVLPMERVKATPRYVLNGRARTPLSRNQFQTLRTLSGGAIPKQGPPSGLGNPGPLGLAAFALTTFMLSVFNAGSNLIDSRLQPVVVPVAFFYGGIVQFAAGMWEFRVNNTFGATAFASYGGFWTSFAAYVFFIVPLLEPTGKVDKATGLFLFSFLLFTLYMTVASWAVSKAVFAVFITLSLTFLLLVIGNLGGNTRVTNAGGWFGIFTAFFAWYASAAVVINTTFERDLLPIGVYKNKKSEQPKQKEKSKK